MSPELKVIFDKYSHFFTEIRKRVVGVVITFLVSMLLGFIFYEKIIGFLIGILSLKGINIVFTSPFQFISLAISCGIASGVIILIPLLIFQILSFLRPALKEKEFGIITKFLPFSFILFLIGFITGAMIMKWQIEIFLTRSTL